ncbi:unnamed protein product [Callosobruchus maculatus]|uniref:Reverse transcriptase domain-containing protein n=1 Tax=Callosobruchus maculatus TaxID=64391 RepID=A0A653D2R3_CALMS|nr:unnamed protein product [Callosobruchus maculatus]
MIQKGIPQKIINIVKELYKDATSQVLHKGHKGERISIKRGVKQGCVLSPLLFNIVLDCLMRKICKDKGKKKQRWDKGNPPPCPEKPVNPGKNCPKEEEKLPYRRERDFKKPYYKRPDEPYSDFHDY